MVAELLVHAAEDAVKLIVQTVIALQNTPFVDSGRLTWSGIHYGHADKIRCLLGC